MTILLGIILYICLAFHDELFLYINDQDLSYGYYKFEVFPPLAECPYRIMKYRVVIICFLETNMFPLTRLTSVFVAFLG